jgi:hypothetical protein
VGEKGRLIRWGIEEKATVRKGVFKGEKGGKDTLTNGK